MKLFLASVTLITEPFLALSMTIEIDLDNIMIIHLIHKNVIQFKKKRRIPYSMIKGVILETQLIMLEFIALIA